MKIIGVFGLSELSERLVITSLPCQAVSACCACNAWRLQVSHVSETDIRIFCCHKSINFNVCSFISTSSNVILQLLMDDLIV